MDQKSLTAAGIAGLAIGLLSGLPLISALNCLLCAPIWGGGMLAVWLYKRNSGALSVDNSKGTVLGLIAGLIGGLIAGVLGLLTSGGTAAVISGMQSQIESMPAEQQEMMRQIITMISDPSTQIIGLVCNLVLFAILGAIGGVIGAAVFGKPKSGIA
jgi:hypothetical protein